MALKSHYKTCAPLVVPQSLHLLLAPGGQPGGLAAVLLTTSAKSSYRLRDAGAWNKSWRCSWTARITDRSDWPPTPHLSQNASTCPSSAWGDLTGLELVWANSCLGLEFLWVAGGWILTTSPRRYPIFLFCRRLLRRCWNRCPFHRIRLTRIVEFSKHIVVAHPIATVDGCTYDKVNICTYVDGAKGVAAPMPPPSCCKPLSATTVRESARVHTSVDHLCALPLRQTNEEQPRREIIIY